MSLHSAAFRLLFRIALAVVTLTIASSHVRAATEARVRLKAPRETAERLSVDLVLEDAFPEDTLESIRRGTSLTLGYTVELWKERSRWFDKLVSSRTIGFKIGYDIFREEYVVESAGGRETTARNAALLNQIVGAVNGISVAPIDQLEPGDRYYLAASAVLRPLSIEDLKEVEEWLRGEVKPRRGGITSYPRAMLDFLVGLSGLAGENIGTRSPTFTVESLPRVAASRTPGKTWIRGR